MAGITITESEMDENKIIQFSDLQLQRIHKNKTICEHRHLLYDLREQTIECNDCGNHVSPFRAFVLLAQRVDDAWRDIQREREQDKDDSQRLLLRATRKVDRAWRSKRMVPTCPHCHAGILPTDGFGGGAISKDLDAEQRRFRAKNPNNLR